MRVKEAENSFIGVNCGIMDQFSIGMGKAGKAILLNCNTMEYKYSDLKLKDMSIIVANTNKKRSLSDSKYNERCLECKNALSGIRRKLNINYLAELTVDDFERHKSLIDNPIEIKRARHVVYENDRTIKAASCLEQNDISQFGMLMNKSHISLRDDYEVTGRELDTLVELAWEHSGTIGSRMTGAGFGGCTVSIVRNGLVEDFILNVGEKYARKIGYSADFYIVSPGDGARELKGEML
jgi:galactokinase